MKYSITSIVCLIVCMQSGSAQTAPSGELVELRNEIRQLRLELLQQNEEFQKWKVRNLTLRLQQIQNERQHVSGQKMANEQELNELEISIGQSGEDERVPFEGLKEQLTKDRLPRLEAWMQSVVQRESETAAELQAEGQRLAEIQERIQRISGQIIGRK